MGRIRGHLHTTRWRERRIGQRRSHETNSRSLTYCEVKGEGNWSAEIAWDESEVLHPARWREMGVGQRRSHGTNPMSLTSCEVEGEGVGQRRSHETNSRSLTYCEVKGEGSWSAEIAWDESEVTYTLGGGRGELISADRMGPIRCHLHAGR